MYISDGMIVRSTRPYDRDSKMNYRTGKADAYFAAVLDMGYGEFCLADVHEHIKAHGHKPILTGEIIETFVTKDSACKALVRYYRTYDISY